MKEKTFKQNNSMDLKKTVIGAEPLTIEEVKLYCKIDYNFEDSLISSLISSVRDSIERFTGLSLVETDYVAYWDYLPQEAVLPYPEHEGISEVKINGEVSENYAVKGLTQLIVKPYVSQSSMFGSVVSNDSLEVKYTTTGDCPEAIKNEMLRLLDEKYRNRGNTFSGTISELNENSYANLAQFCTM